MHISFENTTSLCLRVYIIIMSPSPGPQNKYQQLHKSRKTSLCLGQFWSHELVRAISFALLMLTDLIN